MFFIELFGPLAVYLVGGLVAYRSKWIETETRRRRGERLPKKSHGQFCYSRKAHGPCCFRAFWPFLVQTDQRVTRPTLSGILWPVLAIATITMILAKVAWFFVPVKAIVAPGKGLKGWLHPEVKIADKKKLEQMERDLEAELFKEQLRKDAEAILAAPQKKPSAAERAVAKLKGKKGYSQKAYDHLVS